MHKIDFIKNKTLILTALVLIAAFSLPLTTLAKETSLPLTAKEKIEKFYEAQFERFYDYIPGDILKKHATTIAKIDKKITTEKIAGAVTSQNDQFNLSDYRDTIRIGILPYTSKGDPFSKELEELASDIDKYTIDYSRLQGFNKSSLGDKAPIPTTQGKATTENLVKISGSGYNTTNAVNYAKTWTQNGATTRNSAYNFYSGMNDCTNFVSQVLKAGGISQVRTDTLGYDYDDAPNWYYANTTNNPPSWTWGGAHNLYTHFKSHSSNVRRVYSTADLRVGDIVMWDTNPNDGIFHIGHNTVVTKIQNGIIYLTYHSSDREDEPISTLFNKNYLAYGWAVKH